MSTNGEFSQSLPDLRVIAKSLITISESPTDHAGKYAKALRAIGHALEALDVEAFELSCEDKNYIVRVESQRRKNPRVRDILKERGLQILQYLFPSRYPSVSFQLIYTPEDIERLEDEGESRRRNAETDPHRLTQALRAIGFYIDFKGVRLLQVSRHGELLMVRYETTLGSCDTEEFTLSSLYTLFVQMYVKRRDRRKAKQHTSESE